MLLKVSRVSKRFGGASALDNFSFEFGGDCERFALLGPNGSGKTTFLNIVTGIIRQDAGVIELEGADVSDWYPDRRVRFGVRRSFQGANVFEGLSVERNARLALLSPPKSDAPTGSELIARVDSALEEFELDQVRHHDASQISFGQRRLLSLLMATIRPFKLLLLDEPVAGLQPRLVSFVADLIRRLDGMIIVVEHNFEFIERLNAQVLFLTEGQLIETGSLRDVLAAPAVRRVYS